MTIAETALKDEPECQLRKFATLADVQEARTEILSTGRYSAASYQWHVRCGSFHLQVVPRRQ